MAADRRSDRHTEISAFLHDHEGWASPTPVIAETAWLILDRLGSGPHQRFLRLVTAGELEPLELTKAELGHCVELTDRYADLRLDLADAALVAVAERLELTTIATLNHRDFRVVRPAHCDAFVLLP